MLSTAAEGEEEEGDGYVTHISISPPPPLLLRMMVIIRGDCQEGNRSSRRIQKDWFCNLQFATFLLLLLTESPEMFPKLEHQPSSSVITAGASQSQHQICIKVNIAISESKQQKWRRRRNNFFLLLFGNKSRSPLANYSFFYSCGVLL